MIGDEPGFDATLPPCSARLGIEPGTWRRGHTELLWQVPKERRLTNTAGSLHGGYLCVLADALLGSALRTLIGLDQLAVTVDLQAHFLEPVALGARLTGEGHVVQHGRTLSFLEAEIRDAERNLPVLTASASGVALDRAKASSSPRPAASARTESEALSESPRVGEDPPRMLPPWFEDFGARYRVVDGREVEIVWPIRGDRFDNRGGAVQGGYVAYVADSAMGFALIEGTEARAMATTTLSVQLLRPALSGMDLRVRARVVRRGRRFGFMGCDVEGAGRTIARGHASGLLLFD